MIGRVFAPLACSRPLRTTPRFPGLGAVLLLVLAVLAGCGSSSTATGTSAQKPKGTVNVAYAGSLVDVMEHKIGPAFQTSSGYTYQGKGAGSTALANQIKSKLIAPDVFISASAKANESLMGADNGNVVQWYAPFASTAMVIGYSPKSAFASQFQSAASGGTPWYTVLEQPGVRLGRTDPALDPKGVNTIYTMELAESYYAQPSLAQKILGGNTNQAQIFPEEDLVARLSAGQLDAGFFYLNEVKSANLPYIALPNQINLSDPALKSTYAAVTYTDSKGVTSHGAPVLYTITIPSTVKDEAGAEAFVRYMLTGNGQAVLRDAGVQTLTPTVSGSKAAIPSWLSDVFK